MGEKEQKALRKDCIKSQSASHQWKAHINTCYHIHNMVGEISYIICLIATLTDSTRFAPLHRYMAATHDDHAR